MFGRRGMTDDCEACLGSGYSCAWCKVNAGCTASDCKSGARVKGVYGFSGITDSIQDAFSSMTACGILPIALAFAAGYFAKKQRWI